MPTSPGERGKPNEALRLAREERGWTQSDAAAALGYSLEAVQSWERGRRNPRPKQQARLCEVYQRSPEELNLQTDVSRKTGSLSAQGTHALVPTTSSEQNDSLAISRSLVGMIWESEKQSLFQQIVDKKRRRMLMNIWNMCINIKLRRLLGHTALITLDLMELPGVLDSSYSLATQNSDSLARDLPVGTSIVEVYDRADGELLILGEPGVGKTILLLALACELLMRAGQHESYPMPAIFNLASWTEEQITLDEWLTAELQTIYHIPEKIGRNLVETDQLIILLDGLDETSEETRPACVKAIQAYQQKHPFVSLVLCCRREKYYAQATPLTFQRAIAVKPLTREQIDLYLASAHCQLEAVKKAFQEDLELQELCTNPLMLSIVSRIYQDKGDAAFALSGSIKQRRRQIFEMYVQQMLMSRGTETRYTLEQTRHWLMWLAGQLKEHRQTEFYIERLQPDWLPDNPARQRFLCTMVRLIFGIQIIISAGLFAWLRGGKQEKTIGVGIGVISKIKWR
ncbi:MAG TPA: helix-turn-helix domain-containing protein [Ktedonobacteraceae bacterium]|nr:helix-turn-helix domain-containing protein [Ktedonobacteraceae bacterium]